MMPEDVELLVAACLFATAIVLWFDDKGLL